ncbi:UNVERIFIED_CONTAM: hypothetical protein Sradi_6939000 [Sesamum radiatum]|uniref:Uncharacterized protein n=1 Tax=Sesamum radiatum TaxID=300843 RepID=A0AAW2JGJ3_SESRA
MLPKSNSLCPLSHNTHTDSTHTTHTESTAVHDEDPDGDNNAPEAEILGGDSLGLAGKESPCTREEFDFDGFYELANRVLNGDSEAMANLNSLKERWEQKFKTSKNLALKSVTGRPSTPFRPRISLLPRRSVRTGTDPVPLTDLAYPGVRPGIDRHGSSSSSHLGLATSSPQGQEPQESLLPPISDVPAQLLEDLSQDSRTEGPSCNSQENEPLEASISRHQPVAAGDLVGSERPDCRDDEFQACTPVLDSTPPLSAQDGLLTHSNIYIGNVKLQPEYVDTIAGAFLQSSRKTLHFVPPTRQNGEIIIRPTKEVVDSGSKKWRSTAVGYFFWVRDRTFLK